MRKLLTVLVMASLIAIAILASLDAFRGSSPDRADGRTTATKPAPTPPPEMTATPPPIWEGEHRRMIRLGRGAGAEWEETRVLDPGSYELTMRLDLPRDADVEVSLRSGTTFTFGLFGERVPRDCTRQNERDVCVTAGDFPQAHSEEWTLVVRKLSTPPAALRLMVAFTRVPPTQS